VRFLSEACEENMASHRQTVKDWGTLMNLLKKDVRIIRATLEMLTNLQKTVSLS
jgi:hypothetical protein